MKHMMKRMTMKKFHLFILFMNETKAPFSRSLGMRDPSPPARVPAPYGLPPWTSSLLNRRGLDYPMGTNIMPWCASCVRKVSVEVSWPPP